MQNLPNGLLDLLSDWIEKNKSIVAAAKLAVADDGSEFVFGAKSHKEGFDWDFSDMLADLEVDLLNAGFNNSALMVVSLIIFDHFVHVNLPDSNLMEYESGQWKELP